MGILLSINFFFQSGEFFSSPHTAIWLSIVIPVFIFFLGFAVNTLSQKLKLFHDLKSKEEFIRIWIETIEDPINKQIEAYKEFSKNILDLDSQVKPLRNYNLHIDKLKSITPTEYVRIFITNKKRDENKEKTLYKFINSYEFIDLKHDSGKIELQKFLDIENEYFDAWNKSLMIFHEKKLELIKSASQVNEDQLIVDIGKVLEEWKSIDTKENEQNENKFNESQEEFYKNNYAVSVKYLNKVYDILENAFKNNDLRTKLLMPVISDLLVTYKRISYNHKIYSKKFLNYYGSLKESLNRMKEAKSDLIKIPFKTFWNVK